MSVDGVAEALEAMADDGVRERIAAGEDAEVSGFSLTADEREMVIAAAGDYPEVEGFQFRRASAGQINVGPMVRDTAMNVSPFSAAVFYVGNGSRLNRVINEPH